VLFKSLKKIEDENEYLGEAFRKMGCSEENGHGRF